MNPPKKNHGILLFFMGLSGIFLVCAIVLSARQVESQKTIQSLQKTVDTLNHKISTHQEAIAKTDFYRFQENIYRLQTPEFAQNHRFGFQPEPKARLQSLPGHGRSFSWKAASTAAPCPRPGPAA